jgi:hypothetical protein
MSNPSYRAIWEKRFQMNRESIIQVSTWDPFKNWELSTAPDNRAEDELINALAVLYGHGDTDLARCFLERCLQVAERTLAEDKLRSPRCRDNYPDKLGRLLRARTYAQALLGAPVPAAAWQEAAAAFEQACATYPKHKWDDFLEETLLASVRLALMGGDSDRVQRLLKRRRVLRWYPEQDDLVRGLAAALQAGSPPTDEDFRARARAYFNQVRDPDYYPNVGTNFAMLRLEIGALYDKYLVSLDNTINWQRTIEAIAA